MTTPMQAPMPGREHEPVLLQPLLEGLALDPGGAYIDATYGRGGHSRAVLQRLGVHGRLFAFDKDPEACAHARRELGVDARFSIRQGSFTLVEELLEQDMQNRVSGVFFDLGVASPQLDSAERGFSFQREGPLDMRMDTTRGVTAAQWLQTAGVDEVARVLREYGEERNAKRIAAEIAGRRSLQTTSQLAAVIARISGHREKIHPATRSFLALRLFINRELEDLGPALDSAVRLLRRGGRLAVITFHSLEDRLVKRFIRTHAVPPRAPRDLPVMDDGPDAVLKKIGKPVVADDIEVARNPRARSARLRLAEKL